MGCHTWFSVPYITDKEEMKKLALLELHRTEYPFHPDEIKTYEFAISNNLFEAFYFLITDDLGNSPDRFHNQIAYLDYPKHFIVKYNKEKGTNYFSYYDVPEEDRHLIKHMSDEPRIGGYPEDIVIESYNQFIEFLNTGFDSDGEHFDFYWSGLQKWDKDAGIMVTRDDVNQDKYKTKVLAEIEQFFIDFPQGIITFG